MLKHSWRRWLKQLERSSSRRSTQRLNAEILEARLVLSSATGFVDGTVFVDANGNGSQDEGDVGAANWSVFVDENGNGQFDRAGFLRSSGDVPQPIPDLTTATSHLVVSDIFEPVVDIDVTLDLTHTYDGDLIITLVSPAGTQVVLSNRNGGGGDDYRDTTFDDEAVLRLVGLDAPFSGTFRPDENLSAFDNEPVAGDWQLVIADTVGGDFGTLNSWSLTFTTSLSLQGEPLAVTDAQGHYTIRDVRPGTYPARVILQPGFEQTFPSNGLAQTVTVINEQTVLGVNFGVQEQPGSVSGFVYTDADGNGSRDQDDVGRNGVTIELLDAVPREVLRTTVTSSLAGAFSRDLLFQAEPITGAPGYYKFYDVPAGDYLVHEVVPERAILTQPVGQQIPLTGPNPVTQSGSYSVTTPPTGTSGSPAQWLPDLIVDPVISLSDAFRDGDTIRFSQATPNVGHGPLRIVGGADNGDGTQAVRQRVFNDDGSFTERPAGNFAFHPEHNHIHFNDYTHYSLRAALPDANGDGVPELGATLRAGNKTSFCLIDVLPYSTTPALPNAAAQSSGLGCDTEQQISVGWADIYGAFTEGQEVNIAGLPDGQYWLEANVDPDNHFIELDETNNFGRVLITLAPELRAYPVTVVAGENSAVPNFGNFERFSISGTVFGDTNGDGFQADEEVGLAHRGVFIDVNGDGVLNNPTSGDNVPDGLAQEPWTLTDADGHYSFEDFGSGVLELRAIAGANEFQSAPNSGLIEPNGGAFVLNFGLADLAFLPTVSIDIFDDFVGTSTLFVSDSTESGLDNNITITVEGDTVVISDPGLILRTTIGERTDLHTVRIPRSSLPDVTDLVVSALGGNDRINLLGASGFGRYFLNGDAGDDILIGTAGQDVITGGDGNDVILAGGANDYVSGGNGADILNGGDGDDWLYGDDGFDLVRGDGGNDTLTGGIGGNILDGGDGIDVVREFVEYDATLTDTELLLTNPNSMTFGPMLTSNLLPDGSLSDIPFDLHEILELIAPLLAQIDPEQLAGLLDLAHQFLKPLGLGDLFAGLNLDHLQEPDGLENLVHEIEHRFESVNFELLLSQLPPDALDFDISEEDIANLLIGLGLPPIPEVDSSTLTSIEGADLKGFDTEFTNALVTTGRTFDASAFTGSVTMLGASGNDTLLGGSGDDVFFAGNGNNSVSGGSGHDSIVTGIGIDLISGGVGNDSISGGAGNDVILGGEGDDQLAGGAGNDQLNGEGGNDNLRGDSGNDVLAGGPGTDSLVGNGGNDSLDGGAGRDMLQPGLGSDLVRGGTGSDVLREVLSSANSVTLTNTRLTSDSTDVLDGIERAQLTGNGLGNVIDTTAFAGSTTVNGAGGNDSITTGSGTDSIDGGGGNDLLNAGAGSDTVRGGEGSDRISGGAGNDLLDGGSSSDTLVESGDLNFVLTATALTGLGTDQLVSFNRAVLTGGASANTIDASAFIGSVTLEGGDGNDSLTGASGSDVINGGAGNDLLKGRAGDDSIDGGAGNDILNGGDGNDSLTGGDGDDGLSGFTGNDLLNGLNGNDTLIGGVGNDSLYGGAGNDLLRGDSGTDVVAGQVGTRDTAILLGASAGDVVNRTNTELIGLDRFFAPGIDHQAMAISAATILVLADLRRRDDKGARLDRAGALEQVPMRLAGWHSESRRNRDQVTRLLPKCLEQSWKPQVIADRQAKPSGRRIDCHHRIAGGIGVRFAPAFPAGKINIEHVDLVIARGHIAGGIDHQRTVGPAPVLAQNRERAQRHPQAAARCRLAYRAQHRIILLAREVACGPLAVAVDHA